jgi:hypothetical protein
VQNAALRDDAIVQLRTQLDSFAVHALASPLLLVGTRKAQAVATGGHTALARLSDSLRKSLSTSPAYANVVPNGALSR